MLCKQDLSNESNNVDRWTEDSSPVKSSLAKHAHIVPLSHPTKSGVPSALDTTAIIALLPRPSTLFPRPRRAISVELRRAISLQVLITAECFGPSLAFS